MSKLFFKIKDEDLILLVLLVNALVIGIGIGKIATENALKTEPPVIIYQVDNAGAEMVGKIESKEIYQGKYTLDAGVYGKFLVPKEVYDSVEIGDEIPDYIKGVTNKEQKGHRS